MYRTHPIKNVWPTQNKHSINYRHFSLLLFCIVAMPGCSSLSFNSYGANGLPHKEFVRYVEEVFRLENRMTSEMMLLSEDGDSELVLLQAEQHMHKLCASLNEYVSRDIDGLYKGYFLRRRVEDSAIDCEKAAHALEALLNNSKT